MGSSNRHFLKRIYDFLAHLLLSVPCVSVLAVMLNSYLAFDLSDSNGLLVPSSVSERETLPFGYVMKVNVILRVILCRSVLHAL